MSRRKQKRLLWFYIGLFLLSGYLFFRFGLNLFVDWAFFITQKIANHKPTPATKNAKIAIITEPVLEEMPDATNEAILYIKGQADSDTQIQLFLNQKRVSTMNADLQGKFEFEQVLTERNNQFYVKSIDSYSQKSTKSKFYNVTFIEEPPNLEIGSPQDGKKYYDPTVTVEGKTDKEVFVKVNDTPVVIKADGSFTHTLTLNKGDNEVKILATDLAGNTTEKNLRVVYVE